MLFFAAHFLAIDLTFCFLHFKSRPICEKNVCSDAASPMALPICDQFSPNLIANATSARPICAQCQIQAFLKPTNTIWANLSKNRFFCCWNNSRLNATSACWGHRGWNASIQLHGIDTIQWSFWTHLVHQIAPSAFKMKKGGAHIFQLSLICTLKAIEVKKRWKKEKKIGWLG